MIIGILMHALLGMFLSAVLWFFALGGMSACFKGRSSGWLDSPRGGMLMIVSGAVLGYISYVTREHDFIARTPENAARFRLARRALFLVVPIFTGYLLWSLKN